MTAAEERDGQRVVTVLRRPPVRQSTLVRAGIEHTFSTFVASVGAWWPVRPFSAGKDRVRDVTIERRPGGRVYETWDDGTEVGGDTVTAWEPPGRWVMTWTGTLAPTEVEFTFAALNLNTPKLKYYGADRSQPLSSYSNGRQFYLGVRLSL